MSKFSENTSLFIYSREENIEKTQLEVDEIELSNKNSTTWLNTYGLDHKVELYKVIELNKLDDFLRLLLIENNHRNKTLVFENSFFITLKTIHLIDNEITSEQMIFVVGSDFVWSIQEKKGDYFENIRIKIRENKGLVRKKSSGYLLYLLVDAIIDNYYVGYENLHDSIENLLNSQTEHSDTEYVNKIESHKQLLFRLKKAINSLRDAILKLENIELEGFETRYYIEAKEQAHYLLDGIDFDITQLESKLNIIFNLQNNRLNNVMKTLTIFSVIFIPLTFLAGIYGMNFDNLPGAKSSNGFYIFMSILVLITIITVVIINKRKWLK